MRLLAPLLASSIFLLVPFSARGQTADANTASSIVVVPASPPAAEHPLQHDSWYGGQVILADVASLGLTFGGIGIAAGDKDSPAGGAVAVIGACGYIFGGPIVHFAHGQYGAEIGSLALRLGLPIVGMLDGAFIGGLFVHEEPDGSASDEAEIGLGIGITAGLLGAMAIDAAFLSDEKVNDDATTPHRLALQAPTRLATPQIRWTPTVIRTHSGTAFGIGGTF